MHDSLRNWSKSSNPVCFSFLQTPLPPRVLLQRERERREKLPIVCVQLSPPLLSCLVAVFLSLSILVELGFLFLWLSASNSPLPFLQIPFQHPLARLSFACFLPTPDGRSLSVQRAVTSPRPRGWKLSPRVHFNHSLNVFQASAPSSPQTCHLSTPPCLICSSPLPPIYLSVIWFIAFQRTAFLW